MISLFEDLGRQIQSSWLKANFSERAFPSICAEALATMRPSDSIGTDDLVDWGLSCAHLPVQIDPNAEFGQPPLTVYRSDRFYIAVNFWLESTTSIHEHAFTGAFQVLDGGSLHSTFRFEPAAEVNEHMVVGALEEVLSERLARGDTREIRSTGTIHSLFHLEQPSATIVVRTYQDACSRPQYDYFRAGLAFAPRYQEAALKRRRQLMTLVQRTTPERFDHYFDLWFDASDFVGRFVALRSCLMLVSPERGDELLHHAQERDGAVTALVSAVVADERREAFITRRRAIVSDPELRFFLAVLLNVRGRENALRLIAEKFPKRDAVQSVLEWTRALGRLPGLAPNAESALGFQLDEIVVAALRALLVGDSRRSLERDVATFASRALTAEERRQLVELTDALRTSEIFKLLLDEGRVPAPSRTGWKTGSTKR